MELEFDPREKEARIMEFRKKTSERIAIMLKSGIELADMARMLGGEEFLNYEIKGRHEPVLHFDVERFIQDQIDSGKFLSLPDQTIHFKKMILPPGEGEIIQGGGKGMEKKQIIPRSRYLTEVLTDIKQPYTIISGKNEPGVIRNFSYQGFYLMELRKLILVNDEEGNATFVIHAVDNNQQDWEEIFGLKKEELKNREKVDVVIYSSNSGNWKQKIVETILKEKKAENKVEAKPEGWFSWAELMAETGMDHGTASNRLDKYKKKMPDHIKKIQVGKKRKNSFYSPDLVAMFKQEWLDRPERAPEGWVTNNYLAEKLDTYFKTIAVIANNFRKKNPEWFNKYSDSFNRITEHYSPDLVKAIEKIFTESRVLPPSGWLPKYPLSERLGVSAGFIDRAVEAYRPANPEWFKIYLDNAGRTTEHYSPDLMNALEKKINDREMAPDQWYTCGGLANNLNVDYGTIKRMAESYRKDHPEWYKMYLDASKRSNEHYHPDLVKKITDRLKAKE